MDEAQQIRPRRDEGYSNAKMQEGGDYAGRVGGAIATAAEESGNTVRFWLERQRDQHLRDADAIQSLLDMLPAKIPAGAASALQRLLFK